MKKSSSFFILLCAVIVITSCSKGGGGGTPPPPPGPPTQTDIAAVNSKISTFMTTYNIPGASLAVSKNGKLVYIKGFGFADQATSEKVTPEYRFRLASVSKTFTGVAIMKLVQDGLLNIDSKVFGATGVLGTVYGTQPYSANLGNITVKQLLKHIGGGWGASSGGDPIDVNPTFDNTQFTNWVLNNKPVANAPGTKYDYSNMGYFLLGRIIEKVSGKTYLNYIKENIMAGVGSTNTDIAGKTEAERKTKEVKYYGQGSDAVYTYNIAFPRRDADGGLITTASDLLRLITAVDGFSTRADILNSATITTFTAPSGAAPLDPNYGCGIAVWNNVWFNYGSLPGTRTGFMRGNNGVCVSLLLNSRVDPSSPANDQAFALAMQDVLLDLINNATYTWQDLDQF
jgi:D-alanyl-D-alanine carboxypeptidase